jgi:hypothetical protein
MADSSNPLRNGNGRLARTGLRVLALFLAAAALGYTVYGVRAGIAQALYFKAKYGSDRDRFPLIAARCESAWRLYPFNYYFAMWTAEKAYYGREADTLDSAMVQSAARWCDAGLKLNPYRSSLRLLKMRLLRMQSLNQAISYWEAYVDWDFWNPYNHAVLAELYASGGRWGKAMQALQWVKGSPYYNDTRRTLNELWREQMRLTIDD